MIVGWLSDLADSVTNLRAVGYLDTCVILGAALMGSSAQLR